MGSTIGLRSDHTYFRRKACRATVDANPIWLSQVNIQDLMRSRRDRPGQHRASEFRASLLVRAHDRLEAGDTQYCQNEFPEQFHGIMDTRSWGPGESGSCSRPTRRKRTNNPSTRSRNTSLLPKGGWGRANTTEPLSRSLQE